MRRETKRDTFIFPSEEHDQIDKIMRRAMVNGVRLNKSEVVRVAIQLLAGVSDQTLCEKAAELNRLKPGRISGD